MSGPFEISKRIGTGGMGSVYLGYHRRGGQAVAIKVLLGQFAASRRYLEGFHREVRATARLDHPGVVQVYDYGVLSEEAAGVHEELQAGSLWLAMEYISGGSLAERRKEGWSWEELRRLLLELLDALAHAHARDLVHRDLKPANVLHRVGADGRESWALTDFGIAHVRDPSISEHTADVASISAGTPLFMAPEQLHGDWRSYGAWTDLYALGCMAYLLVSGRAPFMADSVVAIAMKHIHEDPPRLKARMAVPPGFENWLRRLLEKEIGRRYGHAADAAQDLLLLGDPLESPGGELEQAPELVTAPTATLTTLPNLSLPRTRLVDEASMAEKLARDKGEMSLRERDMRRRIPRRTRPQPPKNWRRAGEEDRREMILGAGQGIFGLRQIPFVGREAERDHLWAQFRQVCWERRPRCVVIRGAAGMGKSRLMQWGATRAVELGLAETLAVTHSPIMNATEGLPRTFQSYLSATGLGRPQLLQRLHKVYEVYFDEDMPDEQELGALVEWMNPFDGKEVSQAEVPVVQLESPLERYALAELLLRRIATRRPAVLCLDDGQWGQDSLGFANHLLTARSAEELPLLIVITVRDEALGGRLMEKEYLELIEEDEATSTLEVGLLSSAEQEQLVGQTLGLSAPLVARVKRRTEGNPLFALQMIEDWVNREVLRESDAGYVLADPRGLPVDIETLLEARIEELVLSTRQPARARVSLEAAAALGVDIDHEEWTRVCRNLSVRVDGDLLDQLMVTSVAVPREEGWRFRLPLYRDAVERMSRLAGRWEEVNIACAGAIERVAQNGTCLAERRARHFLAAEHHEEALPLLWRAVENRLEKSAYIQTTALLQMINESYDRLGLGVHDPRRAQVAVGRAEALRYRGSFAKAQGLLGAIFSWPGKLPDEVLANAHRVQASLSAFAGDVPRALQHYEQALPLFHQLDDDRGVAKALHGMGWIYGLAGEMKKGREAFLRGYDYAVVARDDTQAGWCMHGVAETYFHRRDGSPRAYVERAQAHFHDRGCRSGLAMSERTLGDMARRGGEVAQARAHYRRAHHYARSTGHILSRLAEVLLGYCDLMEGDFAAARRRFVGFEKSPKDSIIPFYRPAAALGQMVVAAYFGEKEEFDEQVHRARSLLIRGTPLLAEHEVLTAQAQRLWEEKGDKPRAEVARGLLKDFVREV